MYMYVYISEGNILSYMCKTIHGLHNIATVKLRFDVDAAYKQYPNNALYHIPGKGIRKVISWQPQNVEVLSLFLFFSYIHTRHSPEKC